MIPALLAQIGLPFLVKVIRGAIDKIDHPAAKTAAGALGDVVAAIDAKTISPEQIAETNRHVEAIAALEIRRDNALIASMAASLGLTDAQIDDLFRAAAVL